MRRTLAAAAALLLLTAGCAAGPPTTAPAGGQVTHPVTKVVDGDTLHVTLDGTDESVRFIGINAPEITRGKDECMGQQARDFIADATAETPVVLTDDPTQQDRDRYGRLIRYVELPDGTDLSLALIQEGLAREVRYAAKFQREARYITAESAARTEGRGGWADPTRGGCGWS